MTPRTISDALLEQMARKFNPFDLRRSAPPLPFLPPKVLEAILHPQSAKESELIFRKYRFSFFNEVAEVSSRIPEGMPRTGTPSEMAKFLQESPEEALFDFPSLGLVFISTTRDFPSLPGTQAEALRRWMNYALSPELWGPQGKWVRFHQRLHTLFDEQKLLVAEDFPGSYPLKAQGRHWDKISLQGDLSGETLTLTLPWTFSLSALVALEEFVLQES